MILARSNIHISQLPIDLRQQSQTDNFFRDSVAGVQLAELFQSPVVGLRFHVALPALAEASVRTVRRS
jgi:hypothetical protein